MTTSTTQRAAILTLLLASFLTMAHGQSSETEYQSKMSQPISN